MSIQPTSTLADRKNQLTRHLILEAAADLLEQSNATVPEVTFLAVSKKAGISMRTVFRYFPTRDEFLDAVADVARERMALPPPPKNLSELVAGPRSLYPALEAKKALVVNGLHSELFPRLRERARSRGHAVAKIIDAAAPRAPAKQRQLATANISYFLGATTWHYYRTFFGLSLEDTIACADQAIHQALAALKVTV
jgi:AcrR family transcriptional regulator